MRLTKAEIEDRIPLWDAMSILWVDNEIDEYDFKRLAEEMLKSGLSLEQLELIFLHEVAPVCWGNMLSWSVWTAFDTEWLTGEILKNIAEQERNFLYRCYIHSPIAKLLMAKIIWADWEKAKSMYKDGAENT